MQETLFQQGLDITLFGMGIVFTFLLLLVIGTGIMSRVISRYFPEAEPASHTPSSSAGDENARLHAVIKAAIEQHRKRR
ncbi:OadG family protein [Microbulbifer sp. SSSA002]|uniref:OadG family protein n=1 Tax=unclassified Microbulbifer TaxID=2619833 RepID=UPI004039DBE2